MTSNKLLDSLRQITVTQNEWTVMLCKLSFWRNAVHHPVFAVALTLLSAQTNQVVMEVLWPSNTTPNQKSLHPLKTRSVKVRALSGAPSFSLRVSVIRAHKHTNLSQSCSGCSLWRCRDGDRPLTAPADGFATADVNECLALPQPPVRTSKQAAGVHDVGPVQVNMTQQIQHVVPPV